MGVRRGEAKGDATGGFLDLLDPSDARKLRAAAWRHVRRIDPVTARKVWSARRLNYREALVA